jgi:hypothetical protein
MTKSQLFVAAIVVSATIATPALAQWQTQEPGAYQAMYPNGEPGAASARPHDAMAAQLPARPKRSTVMHVPSAKRY